MIKLINYVKILIILSVITLNNIWNLEFSFFCFDIKDPTCNLNINLESNHTMDNSYNYEFNNNLIYTTELGYGLITLDDLSFKCELILIYDESYNNDYGLYPMLNDINNFVFDKSKSKDTIFYILNINESISETCAGYLIKNNKRYDFYLIIRYADDVIEKLKDLKLYPIIPYLHLEKSNLTLLNSNNINFMNLEMSNLLDSPYIVKSTLDKVKISRGKQQNFGIFFLTTEEYKCGYILVIKNKSESWLREKDFISAHNNLLNQLKSVNGSNNININKSNIDKNKSNIDKDESKIDKFNIGGPNRYRSR